MTQLPAKQTKSTASLLMDPTSFDQMYRVGKMLASSVLFPDHLRKGIPEQAAANGALVMNMAVRLNEDPLTVAQNIYFVGGKPGWSSSYMIAKANQHGVFQNPISWEVTGSGESLSVTAFAELDATGKRVEATCDMAMAKAEGWTKNAKYKSMPEQMLRYRSATFLIRLYCPEVMVGVPAQIEVELGGEMRDITPPSPAQAAPVHEDVSQDKPQDAEVLQDEPEEEPKPAKTRAKKKPEPEAGAAKDTAPVEQSSLSLDSSDDEQFRGLANQIKNDLMEAPIEDVLGMYGPQIDRMAEVAPAVHKDLIEEIEAHRKAQQAAQ